jgi:membrane protein
VNDLKKPWLLDYLLAPVNPGKGPIHRVQRFFARDVWRVRPENLPALPRALYRTARVVFLTVRGFGADGCAGRAQALTYITALSIIPMLALAFSVLKGFGLYESLVDEKIDPYLDRVLGPLAVQPNGQGGGELRVALDEILTRVETTDFSGLGFIGLVIVLWAAMRLLGSVEAAFNRIWGIARMRSLVRRAADYLAIVIAAPIFLVVAIGLATAAQGRAGDGFLQGRLGLDALIAFLLRSAPLLGGWALFTFVYLVMPNARARIASVVLGGFIANLLWQAALYAHVRFQIGVAKYNEFYAGFAAIPVFLVWIQVSWVIVLLGAEIAFAHEHEPAYRSLQSQRELRPGARELLALRATLRIAKGFLSAAGRPSVTAMATELGVAPGEVQGVLRELEQAGLLVAAEEREDEGPVFVLARDPQTITLVEIAEAVRGKRRDALPARAPGDATLDRLVEKLDHESAGSAHNIDLVELVRRAERDAKAEAKGAEQPGVQPS